ncbi:MAG TPA: DUF488 family protein [Micavibrio sp.]|nr:DUF488 family protein [Micavibrio sp.]
MPIYLERIYDPPQYKSGYRVLADRVWPRGMTKEKASVDEWCKDLAPGAALRKWFHHDPEKWAEFSERYKQELKPMREEARALLKRAGKKPLVLLTGTKDMDHTHIIVLRKFLADL